MRKLNDAPFLILMYHGITEPKSSKDARYSCPARMFSRHVRFLRSAGYRFVSLSDIHAHLIGSEPLPPKAVALTFDDGFVNFYENAFPVLRKFAIPSTIFLVSGLIGKTNEWDVKKGYPTRPLLNWEQVRAIRDHGIEIGCHSCTHPYLTGVDEQRAREEIVGSKKALEDGLSQEVKHFAYPYGAMSEQVRRLVEQAGFLTGCSIYPGFNNRTTDPFVLRRIEVEGTDSVRRLWQKTWFGVNDGNWMFPLKYYWHRSIAGSIVGA